MFDAPSRAFSVARSLSNIRSVESRWSRESASARSRSRAAVSNSLSLISNDCARTSFSIRICSSRARAALSSRFAVWAARASARCQIASTERNHQFSKFLNSGGEGGLKTNNPADQEKAIVYNELVANAVAAQTVNDLTHALNKLHDRGINIAAEDLAHFSPYPTSKVKRFGDYPAQVIIDDRPIQKYLPVSSVSMAAL